MICYSFEIFQLPIITIVFSDRSLSLIRVSQERRGFASYGVDFSPPDFAAIAHGFGLIGRRAETLDLVEEEVTRALLARTPLVLDIPVDYQEYYQLV